MHPDPYNTGTGYCYRPLLARRTRSALLGRPSQSGVVRSSSCSTQARNWSRRIPSGIRTSDTLPFTTTPSKQRSCVDPGFFGKTYSGSRIPGVKTAPNPGSGSATLLVMCRSGIWKKPIPDPGVKKALNPGSGSATLPVGHPESADQTRSRSPPRLVAFYKKVHV
jgi:hypothetical protein